MILCRIDGRFFTFHRIGVMYNNKRIIASTNFLVSRASILRTDVVIDKEIEKTTPQKQ